MFGLRAVMRKKLPSGRITLAELSALKVRTFDPPTLLSFDLPRSMTLEVSQNVQNVRQRGRSEVGAEAYVSQYVEALDDARTKLTGVFTILPRPWGRGSGTGPRVAAWHLSAFV